MIVLKPRVLVKDETWQPLPQSAGRWVDAGALIVGVHAWRVDGTTGAVESVEVVRVQQRMYNLTVDVAHTFFVGDGAWLVHNECVPYEVGPYNVLKNKENSGDGLDIHHLPQKHPAAQVVPGYHQHYGPAIALPRGEHIRIPTQRGRYTGTVNELLAKDLNDLADYTNAPPHAFEQLIHLFDQMFPGVR